MKTSPESQEEQLRKLLAEIHKTMGHPQRIFLLQLLEEGEKCVGLLSKLTGLRMATISQHLSKMRKTGLVKARRQGQQVFYSLRVRELLAPCSVLEELLRERINSGH